MKSNKARKGLLVVVALIVTYLLAAPVVNTKADTTELQVSVSSNPQPSELELYTDTGYGTNATTLTPNDEMALNFTINDGDQLSNLNWVRITVYDSDKTTYDGSENDTRLCNFYWVESTDTWNVTDDGSSTWAINTGSCDDPGTSSAETSYEFSLAFTPGKVTYEETSDYWKFNVTAYDDDSLTAYNTTFASGQTFGGTCQWYGELSITTGATYGNFSSAVAGGDNVTIYNTDAGAGDHLVYQVISNGVWDVQAAVTDWSGGAGIDVDATPIEWINDDDSWDDGFTQPINTTTSTFWDGSGLSYDNTLEAGQNNNAYFRLAIPLATAGGDYTQTLTLTVING